MFNEAVPRRRVSTSSAARCSTPRWDWDHDLTGERAAVIGAPRRPLVQLVPEVRRSPVTTLLQRSANWSPKEDQPYTAKQLRDRADPAKVQAFQVRDLPAAPTRSSPSRTKRARTGARRACARHGGGGGPGGRLLPDTPYRATGR
ncbi:MAG: hypothetical protein U0W40_04650 [Acidimicrobiia bacterium]